MAWETVKIGDVLAKVKRPGKLQKSDYLESGTFPVIDQGVSKIAGYTDNSEIVLQAPLPITVFGDHTRRVKLARSPFVCGADGTQLLYPNTDEIDPEFFYYAVKNVDLSNYFYARHFKFLKDHEISFPDLPTQKRIVSALSAYDSLIENNYRRIALLEEAAHALYREWFVRFRFPGHQHVPIINNLPEGWEARRVRDLLARVKAKPKIRKDEYLEIGRFPCVDQGQSFIGGFTNEPEAIYSDELPLIVFGDHTRALKYVDFPFARGADGTQICKSNDPRLSPEFFYWALVNIDLSNYAYARHFKFLKDQEVVIPDKALADDFTEFAKDAFKQIKALRQQSFELTKARDVLLPRLMDGRIEI